MQVGYHLTTFSTTIEYVTQLEISEAAGVESLLRKKRLSDARPQ